MSTLAHPPSLRGRSARLQPLSAEQLAAPHAPPQPRGEPRLSVQEAVARVKAWHAAHDPVMQGFHLAAEGDAADAQGRAH